MVAEDCLPLEGLFADHEALGCLMGVEHIIINLSIIETDPSKSFHGRIFLNSPKSSLCM